MNWTLDFAPLAPWWLIALFAALGLCLIAVAAFARTRGWPLRALALAALVLALLDPTIRREEREQLKDIAVVLVDRSLSQGIAKRPQRTDATEADLLRRLARIANLETRTVTVHSSLAAEEDGTRLFKRLYEALADVPPERFAGAILITDGQVHDVPASLAGQGYDAPVHALLTGDRDERDRRIVIEEAPRFGIVGRDQLLRFRVEEAGPGARAPAADVTLSVDGKEESVIAAPVGRSVTVPLKIPHGGKIVTELAAAGLPAEISLQNNRAVVQTDGIRDRLRVLLVSGEPHAGERTWRNLLKADPAVDLVHFTILRPPEKQDGTPIKELSLIAFPTRELFVDKLTEFDLIIFDRYQRRGVLPLVYLSNVVDYVEKGGAVLTAVGPDFATPFSLYRTPLATVLPSAPTGSVLTEPYRPEITSKGRRHPVTRALPGAEQSPPGWGRWFRLVEVDAKAGDAVMAGPGERPLMILAHKGEGRVAQLLSDHAWLWARGYEGGGPQAELLRRLAHWLMKEPDLEEEALSGEHNGARLVVERRTMAERAEPVRVTSPSGKTETVTLTEIAPGLWRGEVEVAEPGVHRLADGSIAAVAAVGPADPREMAELRATEEKLQPVLKATGGGAFWIADGGAETERVALPHVRMAKPSRIMAGPSWLGLKDNGAFRVRALTDLPLFGTLLALAALLLLLGALWYREGR